MKQVQAAYADQTDQFVKTKDNPFKFSEHGAYLCAPQIWAVVPAQQWCTRYLCAATGTALLPVQTKKINITSERRTKLTQRNI